jgi:hypothetical protein
MVIIFAIFYGVFRYGGEYTYIAEGGSITEYPDKTAFNVPIIGGSVNNDTLEIESPDSGIQFVDISNGREATAIHAKNCGRMKVRLIPERKGWATFDKSGCFLDW